MTPNAPFPLFDEAGIRQAIVAIRLGERNVGTGFFVGPDRALTCHHVIADLEEPFSLELHAGTLAKAWLDQEVTAPASDVAVLRVNSRAPAILPCAGGAEPGVDVWASGFPQPAGAVAGKMPTTATVGGAVTVEFRGPPAYTFHGFTLEASRVRPGLSGGPVVDLETGAVLGIVDAEQQRVASVQRDGTTIILDGGQLDGYAIDLDRTASLHAPLAKLLAANRAIAPAYGRHLNGTGALRLCGLHIANAVRELENSGLFSRATYTPREVESQIREFINSDRKLFPLIGHTGVGKTTLLADLAERLTREGIPVALVRGFHVRADQTDGLAGALDSELGRQGGRCFPGLARLISALPARLVVLLDAANEIAFSHVETLLSWWSRTTNWVTQANVRLVISSRLQSWEVLKEHVVENLCFRPHESPRPSGGRQETPRPRDGVPLGDFTANEFAQARVKYGLVGQAVGSDLSRHPFFLRVWAEVEKEPTPSTLPRQPTRHDLMAAYIDTMARRVSRTLKGQYSPDDVRVVLFDLGQYALQVNDNVLGRAVVDGRLAGDRPLRNGLLAEHVLEEGPDNFRFAFDSVAEFAMSKHIDPSRLTSDQIYDLRFYGFRMLAGAIGRAVIRVEHEGQGEVVNRVLEQVANSDRSSGTNFAKLSCVSRLLADFHDAPRYFPVLARLVETYGATEEWPPVVVVGMRKLAFSGRLPVQDVLSLLRLAFVHDDPYRYEWGHWTQWSTKEFEEDCRDGSSNRDLVPCLVLEIEDYAPHAAMQVLLDWLDDETKVSEYQLTIGDAASAFLYHRSELFFDPLCDALAARPRSKPLLIYVAVRNTERAISLIERWAAQPSPSLDLASISIAKALSDQKDILAYESRLVPVLESIWDRTTERLPETLEYWSGLVHTLARCPSVRDVTFRKIQPFLQRFPPRFQSTVLEPFTEDKWREVLAIVDQWSEHHPAFWGEAASELLRNFFGDPERTEAAVTRLEKLLSTHNDDVSCFVGRAVESLLNRVPTDSRARNSVLSLARVCIHCLNRIGRACIIYSVSRPGNTHVEPQEKQLLLELLRTETDYANQTLLIEKLCGQYHSFVELLQSLAPLTGRMPKDKAERAILGALYAKSGSSLTPQYFATWLKMAAPSSLGKPFGVLVAELKAGAEVETALRRVLYRLL